MRGYQKEELGRGGDIGEGREEMRYFPFASPVMDEARYLMRRHGRSKSLRTLDSLQLAFFLVYCDDEDVFLCADRRNSLQKWWLANQQWQFISPPSKRGRPPVDARRA